MNRRTDRVPQILVTRGKEEEELSLAKVADTIGSALTDLLVSRQEQEDKIFNDENRAFVSNVAQSVANSLTEQVQEGGHLRLSRNDLYLLIEKALIENDAHDVAKSLVFSRSLERNGEVIVSEEPQTMPVRLIRRNGNVVPWSQTKIEIAVRKAFLSIKEDPEAAVQVSHAVTEAIRGGDSAFAHIENVQDLVRRSSCARVILKRLRPTFSTVPSAPRCASTKRPARGSQPGIHGGGHRGRRQH